MLLHECIQTFPAWRTHHSTLAPLDKRAGVQLASLHRVYPGCQIVHAVSDRARCAVIQVARDAAWVLATSVCRCTSLSHRTTASRSANSAAFSLTRPILGICFSTSFHKADRRVADPPVCCRRPQCSARARVTFSSLGPGPDSRHRQQLYTRAQRVGRRPALRAEVAPGTRSASTVSVWGHQ